jgi:hypothetical protein
VDSDDLKTLTRLCSRSRKTPRLPKVDSDDLKTLTRLCSRSRKTPRLPKADSDDLKALEDLCSWERVRARLTLGPSCREDAVKMPVETEAGSQTEAAQDGLGGPVRIGAILRNP